MSIFLQFLYILSILISLDIFQAVAAQCNEDWEDASDAGLGYLWFETSIAMNYADAITFCKDLNANLVEVDSRYQTHVLVNKLKTISRKAAWLEWSHDSNQYFWKVWWGGATDLEKEGTWKWSVSGKTLNQQNFIWGPGQPDNHDIGEHCLCFSDNENYFGNDCNCYSDYEHVCYVLSSVPAKTVSRYNCL